MAFPAVDDQTSNINGSAVTTHTIDFPAGAGSGDLLIIGIVCTAAHDGLTFAEGFTELADANEHGIAYKELDGTEGASTTVDSVTARASRCFALQISGHEAPGTQAPEITALATSTSTAPDSDSITPTGGAKDYLILSVHFRAGNATLVSYPTNYTHHQQDETGASVDLGTCSRQINASSEDPGAWEISSSQLWRAYTIAVHPAAAAANVYYSGLPLLGVGV